MAKSKRQAAGDDDTLVFAAYNTHHERCGSPPRLSNRANPKLYHGYFENRHGEQFIFTFDQATKTGTISGGDLDWDDSRSFTLELLEAALVATQKLAAQIERTGQTEPPSLPIIDAALALGRLTGLTAKDEVIWLRACLEACNLQADRPIARFTHARSVAGVYDPVGIGLTEAGYRRTAVRNSKENRSRPPPDLRVAGLEPTSIPGPR